MKREIFFFMIVALCTAVLARPALAQHHHHGHHGIHIGSHFGSHFGSHVGHYGHSGIHLSIGHQNHGYYGLHSNYAHVPRYSYTYPRYGVTYRNYNYPTYRNYNYPTYRSYTYRYSLCTNPIVFVPRVRAATTIAPAKKVEPVVLRKVDLPPEPLPPVPLPPGPDAPPSSTVAELRKVAAFEAALNAVNADLGPQLSVPKSRALLSDGEIPWVVE